MQRFFTSPQGRGARTAVIARDHDGAASGVLVSPAAADLACRVGTNLNTRVLLSSHANGTAVYLLNGDGQLLCNYSGHANPQGDDGQEPLSPILVALVAAAAADCWERSVTVFLEPVPGTSVGGEGAGYRRPTDDVATAAERIVRHYGPALHVPPAPHLHGPHPGQAHHLAAPLIEGVTP